MTNAIGPSRQDMLGVYLDDHLAGSTAGSELGQPDGPSRVISDGSAPGPAALDPAAEPKELPGG
jgi:hypothetical protein